MYQNQKIYSQKGINYFQQNKLIGHQQSHINIDSLMGGSQAPQQKPNNCNLCNQPICRQCLSCKCLPEGNKDCLQCHHGSQKIVINLDHTQFAKAMKSQITRMWVQTQLSTSQIPFIGGNIHHCLVVLQVQQVEFSDKITTNLVVQGVRTKGITGNMEVRISSGGGLNTKYSETRQTQIDKQFKMLYLYLQDNQHHKLYDRYQNNCYHLAIAIYQFVLGPQLKYEYVKQINNLKDEQVHNFWH